MSAFGADPLVSTAWLGEALGAADLRLVDATWFLPNVPREPAAEYAAAHIPGAVFFAIDTIADLGCPYPHTVPGADEFAASVGALGLGDGSRIVVYDNNRLIASARVWWMFRLFGHAEVAVLDGGLAKWRAEGRPFEAGSVKPAEQPFTPRRRPGLLREIDQVRANLTSEREQLLDARSSGRFHGREPEPRPGVRGGHMPNAVNLPYGDLIATDGTLKPDAELARAFVAAGVDLDRPIVTTCGSGVSAAVLNLALFRLGHADAALYDGSWAEWGARSDMPLAG